jgi:Arc/MetJ-type ribon-helix-helix transcriptional regulator
MTERRPRKIKPSMTYRIPPDIDKKVDDLIASGEFANRADALTALLRFALDYRAFDVPAAVREFLSTDEGRELVRAAAKKKRE